MTDDNSYRWKILIATYLASFAFGMTLQSVPPVIPLLIKDFGITHAEAGLAMSLLALPMIFFSIPVGRLADRHGPKIVGLFAFATLVAGDLVVASSTSFPVLLAGRAVAGAGAFTLVLISPQLISQWFVGKEIGVAMGIWNTAFPLATVISLSTMGPVGQALSWRAPIVIGTAAAILAMIVFVLLVRPHPVDHRGPAVRQSVVSALRRAGTPIWFVGAAWLFFNAASLSFMAFAPDYFQSEGHSTSMAGLLAGMILWGTFFGSPLVGLLLDRGQRPEVLMIIGSVGLAATLLLVPAFPSVVVPVLLLGAVVSSFIVVSVFSLPPSLLDPSLIGLGYGILATCLNIGTAVGPFLVGVIRDFSGAYTVSLWGMAAMALLVAASASRLMASRKAAPEAMG